MPISKHIFPRGTKMRQWKPKTFDRQIRRFGLCVRDGAFADRMTMTEETAQRLIRALNKMRLHAEEFNEFLKTKT